jgi:small subunit ribosomal protein S6
MFRKETVSKFEDFLTSRGAEMVSKEDWGLKKWLTKFKKKKSGFIIYSNSTGEVLLLLKLNLDVTKELCVS